jgi:peptide/nickel transport system ATP-binding protein
MTEPTPSPAAEEADVPLLEVRDLRVSFDTNEGEIHAVDGVDFELRKGQVLAIVGESGSGKSVTALSVLRLIRERNARTTGQIMYRGRDLVGLSEAELRRLRGAEIAMIFQDPLTSLNPLQRVGAQIVEMLQLHGDLKRDAAWAKAVSLLDEVGIPRAQERARAYPHEFSGGMRQRAMIALAMACDPHILIADEATTALDVTIQAQVLELIKRERETRGASVILITHDLGIVADIADWVAVMYAGKIVEYASRDDLYFEPRHPYTWGLLASVPRVDRPRSRRMTPIEGTPPSPAELPAGCRFRPRCTYAFDRCQALPELKRDETSESHLDACWLSLEDKRARRPASARAGDPT